MKWLWLGFVISLIGCMLTGCNRELDNAIKSAHRIEVKKTEVLGCLKLGEKIMIDHGNKFTREYKIHLIHFCQGLEYR